ncbi:hypothetical protein J4856_09680 [Prevotella scopos JCM 17725]|uniref:hypothetical protein n=1 Tax=Prevotella scopos TaxID=589437 RepID=UPI000807506A|nr:hypothetical protein [Prevotella scopos]ANR72752.1 hypothetical protein AXF22_04655 [Prevotella scopos JCM 17725]QUB46363.1 hypothetical protein J4856_09680 [Prevotella scopos JCM 17725]
MSGKNTYYFQNWGGSSKKVVLNVKKAYLRKVIVTTTTSDGIETVSSIELNENAPIYNPAGQRVSKDYKGVVIQNGKKFIKR